MQYAGSAWDELKHIRQAIGFLVIPPSLSLSIQHCYYYVLCAKSSTVDFISVCIPVFSISGHTPKTKEVFGRYKP